MHQHIPLTDMKNILIINQPLGNRGDESAHRALLRTLNKTYPTTRITILTLFDWCNAERDFIVEHNNNNYVNFLYSHNLAAPLVAKWSLQFGFVKLALYAHPILRKLLPYYNNADIVICAPGGICMGGFQDWHHLFMLYVAKICKKPLAYYSRSFGPFPTKTWLNRRFKHISEEMLAYFSFLSIRDKKTMTLANEMQLHYVPAIDTAFLEQPQVDLSDELKCLLNENTIIFVPNSLTWHYAYRQYDQEVIDNFYLSIIKQVQEKYPDYKIVMLPQLCSLGNNGDYTYFKQLNDKLHNSANVIIVSDQYGSDVQQTIIRNAKFVIGARYHSIVFAINNNRPFIALNYEHKIAGLLDILNLSKYNVNIENIFSSSSQTQSALAQCETLLTQLKTDSIPSNANTIAQQCFYKFLEQFPYK